MKTDRKEINKLPVLCQGYKWSDELYLLSDLAVVRVCCQGADWGSVLWLPEGRLHHLKAGLKLCRHFSFFCFYLLSQSCLLGCWRECLHLNMRNSFVYTWRVCLSTSYGSSSLDLNSSLLSRSDVKALNWNYLSFIFIKICLPVSIFLAFALETIEVIRSNITSLERCLREADFKYVWVIVPI